MEGGAIKPVVKIGRKEVKSDVKADIGWRRLNQVLKGGGGRLIQLLKVE